MDFQNAEPYRIKMIERVKKTTSEERKTYLAEAKYNVFKLRAENVYIDCITDSGTTAMSSEQWAALMLGDESYAGCKSFYKLEASVQDIFGMPFVQPTHQGRAADFIITDVYCEKGKYAVGNMHFDTFRGNAEVMGAHVKDLAYDEGFDAASPAMPFKGNLDLQKVQALIDEKGAENISIVVLTITCNNNGGQPVSMRNIRETSVLCKKYHIPLILDCARLAENAYFIKTREEGYADVPIKDITREMFSYCESAMMSSKKDGLVNIGGLLVTRNPDIFEQFNQKAIVHEGFITYGGQAGRDMEALAVGLQEACEFDYLSHRIGQVAYLGDQLKAKGIPIIEPTGGHGVYVDARRFFPHIPQNEFPAQRLVVALYEIAGIRCVELGACAFGGIDKITNEPFWPELETMRIAISRRVYTNSHMDCIVAALAHIYENRNTYRGMRLTFEGKITSLRHFTAGFELL